MCAVVLWGLMWGGQAGHCAVAGPRSPGWGGLRPQNRWWTEIGLQFPVSFDQPDEPRYH